MVITAELKILVYLASARRAFWPPDKLIPFSPMQAISPPIIKEISRSSAQACNTSEYLIQKNANMKKI